MAAGGPVVAGRSGALPEIVGNAAVLVDPFDVLSIAEGIERAFAEKERLVSAGRERARIFTWPRAAEEMTKVYRSLL
jgi:glycosyltransferase involved in cell wall biosynthesis